MRMPGITEEWLREFDKKITGRQVVHNFSAHVNAVRIQTISLQNTVNVVWLPPNSTSRYQSLDQLQGVINVWKAYLNHKWVLFMLSEYDKGRDPLKTIDLLYLSCQPVYI